MELYLIKSAACLAILLVFYKLFLEKEGFHIFKRFYLLTALIVSFTIPLITLVVYVEPNYVLGSFQNPILENIYYPETNNELTKETFDWTSLLWIIYGIGATFFGLRFLLNLSRIVKRIKRNPKTKNQSFINVLLNDLVIPHTFFNYIFLNKSKYEKLEIPEEVLLHEQTHAKQKHSIDVLLIEVFQVVFWFNPLLYLLKNTVKLNHEFLADQAVMNQGVNITAYQQLLLAFSSNASEPQLANAINYSSIKKRFTVMKTQTSQKTVWLKSLVLLPLLVFMVYGFSTTKEITKDLEPTLAIENGASEIDLPLELFLEPDGTLFYKGKAIEITDIETIQPLEHEMSISIKTTLNTNQELVKNTTNSIFGYLRLKGIRKASVCVDASDENENLLKSKTKTDSVIEQVSNQDSKIDKLLGFWHNSENEITFYIQENNGGLLWDIKTKENDFIRYYPKKKDKGYTFTYKGNQWFFELKKNTLIDSKGYRYERISKPITSQKEATSQQVSDYNKLAKYYNAMLGRTSFSIKMSDVERLKYIYGIMSEKQRNDAEQFPDFPESPPIPKTPDTPRVSKDDKVMVKFDNAGAPPPPPPTPTPPSKDSIYITKENNAYSGQASFNKDATMEGHITKLIRENAQFIYKDKKISSEKALELIKANSEMIISHKPSSNKNNTPKTYLLLDDMESLKEDVRKLSKKTNLTPPEAPPAPPTIEEMAKKYAIFYLEGKRIDAKEAINIVNKNKDVNIQIIDVDSKQPTVKLSKKPISFNKRN